MIAFGCSVLLPTSYEAYAGPGLDRAAEPDSPLLIRAAAGSVARTYNLMLDEIAGREGIEALVFIHQDAEIVGEDFCDRVRAVLAERDVAVAGAVGAVGAESIAWWEGSVTWDSFIRCCADYLAPDMPALSWNGERLPPYAPLGDVDTIDGFVMAFSPWAIANLRFDESLDVVYGYDFDVCLQARAAGMRVIAADFAVEHHHPIELVTDPEAWMEAHIRIARKWEGQMPHVAQQEEDWERRARRAEAEAGVARLAGASKLLKAYAGASETEDALKVITASRSWRLTEPLRKANLRRRERREAGAGALGDGGRLGLIRRGRE